MNQAVTTVDESTLPWPGDELVFRVTGGTDRKNFYASGRQSVCDIEAALAVVGTRLDRYSSVLDFGCGCGRILMWLRDLADGPTLHGVDIDERAVLWAAENIPWAQVKVNEPLPPLDYPDGHFDLVFNHSVFTHIDEDHQDLWLAELRRVTRPGGHLLLTVHGEWAFSEYESNVARAGGDAGPVREALGREGIFFLEEDPYVGGPFPDFYHSTFHAPWYVFSHWGRFFTVKAYLPRRSLDFQDFVLLERTADEAATIQPIQVTGPAALPSAAAAGDAGSGAPPEAPGSAPSAPAPAAYARGLLERGPDVDSRTRWGRPASVARRAVNRVLRHHDEHQRSITEALLDALRDLEARLDARILAGDNHMTRLGQVSANMWDVINRQGERINRLEADLLAEIRDLRRLLDPGDRSAEPGSPDP